MLTREIANDIQGQWQQGNDMQSSAIRQFEAQIRGALLLTKAQVQMAGAGKNHWDFAGVAALVMATPSGAVGDGQYDASFLREVQGMWASYMAWLMTPIVVTVEGQSVTLTKRPIDLIMGAPVLASAQQQEDT